MNADLHQALRRFFGIAAAVLLLVPSAVFADILDNDEPIEEPGECDARTSTSCDCDKTEDGVENGCILMTLGLGSTTPWTGSDPVRLRIYTGQANPSISTPAQLKLVLGYTFKNLGADRTSTGAPATVDFVQSKGLVLRFRFVEGSSVGVPLVTLRADDDVRLQMVDVEGWATLSNPAYYDLHPGDGSVWRFVADPSLGQLGDLVRTIDSRGVVRTPEDMGVTVHRDAAGFLRQVCTPTRLADVRILDDRHYTVTVYPLVAEPETDSETGLFVPPANRPTRILDVRRGENDRELIVGFQKGTGDMRTFRYVAQNGDWTLVRPSGLRDAKELYYNDDEGGARRLHLVKAEDGTLLRRTEQNYMDCPWGWAITNKVEGLEGELRNVTTWSYYLDGLNKGKVSEKVEPNGNRIVYEYDALNRLIRRSMPLVEEETLYSYAPVDPSDPVLLRDTRPRCVVRKMQGVEIQRTYYVYGTNGVDVVERVGEQGAAYGGTNVLRTVTTYYPVTGAVTDGLVKSVRHEDGTVDDYAYDFANGVWTATVTHVHEQAPDIIPMRTTRSVRVYNAIGQLVDLRTDLCTIGVEGLVPQADWTPIERLQYAYDIDGNEIRREDLAGRLWTSVWAGNCCGKVSETDWQGITTTFAYDVEGREIAAQTGSMLVQTAYDALDRATNAVRIGIATPDRPEAIVHPSGSAIDSLGRVRRSEGEDGVRRVHGYVYRTEGGMVHTVTEAPGRDCERTTVSVSDALGRPLQECRNGVLRRSIVRTPFLETIYEGSKGTNSPVWHETRSDLFGRVVESRKSGFGGANLHSKNTYDQYGRIVITANGYTPSGTESAQVVTKSRITQFDPSGVPVLFADDVNRNGIVDLVGLDVVDSNAVEYVILDGSIWREQSRFSFPDTNSDAPLRVSTARFRLSGLGFSETTELGTAALVSDTCTIDAFGNSVTRKTYCDRQANKVFSFASSPFSTLSAWTLSVDGNVVSNRTETGIFSARAYDALGRVIASTDGRGNATSFAFDDFGRLSSRTDASGATTAYGYDTLGRRIAVTNALGLVTTASYDSDDNVVSRRGAQYPVDCTYDEYGHLVSLTSYRDEASSAPDTTRWLFDEATGLITNKMSPVGKGPSYDYTPDGFLVRRTWARGVTTDYAYDSRGHLVSKTYSDATPSVSLVYDRLGHLLSAICAGVSTNLYAYDRFGRLTNEVQNGTTIARTYDVLGRATGYVIGNGEAPGSAASYSYDTFGRFASVSSGTNVFEYSYLPGSALIAGMTANTGHAWERIYEPDRDLIAAVQNRFGNRTISRFDYTNDDLGRRIARFDSGEAFDEIAFEHYAYNDRSEVIGSQRFYGSDTTDFSRPVTNRAFGYEYDFAGNRISSWQEQNGDSVATSYESNELNQYVGTTAADETVAYEYDDDGNLLFDNRFRYVWDAENRLVEVLDADTSVSRWFDERGRTIRKQLIGPFVKSLESVWDGWNVVRETHVTNDIAFSAYNVWGLDNRATLQECGGIGALLKRVTDSDQEAFPFYDANGNVSEYATAAGSIAAHFEYAPFGAIISGLDASIDLYPYRFSTKTVDERTGLYEYQFRHYSPDLGRWTNEDLISEEMALYEMFQYRAIPKELEWSALDFLEHVNARSFVDNNPIDGIDLFGLLPRGSVSDWGSGSTSKGNCFRYACNDPADISKGEDPAENPPELGSYNEDMTIICNRVMKALLDRYQESIKQSDKDSDCDVCFYKVLFVLKPKDNEKFQDWDFHWYRQDNDHKWSHKQGSYPVEGPIVDPEANAKMNGYTHICGYMCFQEPKIDVDK